MGSASTKNSPSRFSSSFTGFIPAMSTRAPESVWPSAGKLLIATGGPLWQKARKETEQASLLRFPSPNPQNLFMSNQPMPITILMADDDPDDRQLTKEA